jgi:hypothetical protein
MDAIEAKTENSYQKTRSVVATNAEAMGSGLRINWGKCQLFTPAAEAEAARRYIMDRPQESRPVILEEGIEVLGIPIGKGDYELEHWGRYVNDSSGPRIKAIHSLVQPNSAQVKMALLRYCAVPLAGHMLRTTHPRNTQRAAERHDRDILEAFRRIVNAGPEEEFGAKVVAQIQRPVKLGGFGMASAAKAAAAAYVASVAATHKAVLEIPIVKEVCSAGLPESSSPATTQYHDILGIYRDLKEICSSYDGFFPGGDKNVEAMQRTLNLPAIEVFHADEKKPQQRISRGLQLREWLQVYTEAGEEEKATMLSMTQRGALDAFTVIPFEAELVLTDYVFAFGIRKALGLPTPQDTEGLQCTCGASRSVDEHIRNCRRGGGLIQRHDVVVRTLGEMLHTAGLKPAIEPRATFFETGNGGPDIGVNDYPRAGLNAFIEFSIINPTQHRCRAAAARSYLSAAREREAMKRDKYLAAGEANARGVWGVAMETTGAFGPGLQAFIKAVVAIDQVAMTPEEAPWLSTSPRAYWTQRISVAFHRAAFWMAERVVSAAARSAPSSR